MKYVFLIIALTASNIVLAQQGMKKDRFIDNFEEGFPGVFCQPDQFARACFTYDYQQCVDITRVHVSNCLLSLGPQIPEIITSREEAGDWGQRLGQCAGREFGTKQTADINVTKQCVNTVGETMANSLRAK